MNRISHAGLAAALLSLLASPALATPPPNDACTTAAIIPSNALPYTTTMDTTGATEDATDPVVTCVAPAPDKTVWYRFIPATSDTFEFDTQGSGPVDYTPVVTVFSGTCGGLAPVPSACARGDLSVALVAGTTYWVLVSGAPVTVSPRIDVAVNGVDLCPESGPGPGGGECGTDFFVKVGDLIQLRAINETTLAPVPAQGVSTWSFGAGADPATAEGQTVSFTYTSPGEGIPVVLTYTPPGGPPITRSITMNVATASGFRAGVHPLGAPAPLDSDVATLPSEGGTLVLTVRRTAPSWNFAYAITSVSRATNAGGSTYVSDVSVANLEATSSTVGFELWTAGGVKTADWITIPPGGSSLLPDVIGKVFGLDETYGTLILRTTARVVAGARTYSPATGGGTNGQFALAADISTQQSAGLIQAGETGIFPFIKQNDLFRTNIGVYNLGSSPCDVELQVRDDDGLRVGQKLDFTVPARQYVQKSVGELTGDIPLPSGNASLRNLTAGCFVGAGAYLIDNISQDPSAIPFRKLN